MTLYDGMEGFVEIKSKDSLGISTRRGYAIEYLIFPIFLIKPSYNQLGIYYGDTTGIEEGAIVKIWFRPHYKMDWHNILKSIKEKTHHDNIIKVELVKQGVKLTRLQDLKQWLSLPINKKGSHNKPNVS